MPTSTPELFAWGRCHWQPNSYPQWSARQRGCCQRQNLSSKLRARGDDATANRTPHLSELHINGKDATANQTLHLELHVNKEDANVNQTIHLELRVNGADALSGGYIQLLDS